MLAGEAHRDLELSSHLCSIPPEVPIPSLRSTPSQCHNFNVRDMAKSMNSTQVVFFFLFLQPKQLNLGYDFQ